MASSASRPLLVPNSKRAKFDIIYPDYGISEPSTLLLELGKVQSGCSLVYSI
ncbi:MAG: hypothetical protein Q9205_003500 [Flavoplaca limonia]